MIRAVIICWLLLAHVFCTLTFAQKNIVAIGDSHGAVADGWVNQLHLLRPQDSVLNLCRSGNTIGFDNNDLKDLNELRTIDEHLARATSEFSRIDYYIVLLGTNDCKAVFDGQQSDVSTNLNNLIGKITANGKGTLILVTPPPIAPDEVLAEKYQGGAKRLQALLPHYESISKEYSIGLVDIYNLLKPDIGALTTDGIHLTEDGYRRVAIAISNAIR